MPPTREQLLAAAAQARAKPTREQLLAAATQARNPSIIQRASRAFGAGVDRLFQPFQWAQDIQANEQAVRDRMRASVADSHPLIRGAANLALGTDEALSGAGYSMLNPGDVVLTAGTGGTSAVARKALIPAGRAVSAALGARGVQKAAEGDTAGERIAGGVQAVLGGLGARAVPSAAPPAPAPKPKAAVADAVRPAAVEAAVEKIAEVKGAPPVAKAVDDAADEGLATFASAVEEAPTPKPAAASAATVPYTFRTNDTGPLAARVMRGKEGVADIYRRGDGVLVESDDALNGKRFSTVDEAISAFRATESSATPNPPGKPVKARVFKGHMSAYDDAGNLSVPPFSRPRGVTGGIAPTDSVVSEGNHYGFFTSDPKVAARFASPSAGSITPVDIDFKRPLVLDARGSAAGHLQFTELATAPHEVDALNQIKAALEKPGNYDGIVIKNTADEATVYLPLEKTAARGAYTGQSGMIDPRLAARMAGGATGALAAPVTADEDASAAEKAMRAVGGGAVGFFLPSLMRGRSPKPGRAAEAVKAPKGIKFTTRGKGPLAKGSSKLSTANDDPLVNQFTNPLVREGVQEILERNGRYVEQRRGTVSNVEAAKVAEAIKVDVTKALPKGTTLTAEGTIAATRAVNKTQKNIAELTEKIKAGTANDADKVALVAAQAEADVVMTTLMQARAETGRALQVHRHLHKLLDTGDVDLIRKAAGQLDDDAQKLADEFAALPDDELARYRFLQEKAKKPLFSWDNIRTYYYSNILSGVKTHERNIIGNAANIAFNMATHPLGVVTDAARSKLTGKPRELFMGELKPMAMGAWAGMEEGIGELKHVFLHGMTKAALKEGNASGAMGKLDFVHTEFGGPFGMGPGANPLNWPLRGLQMGDAFFRTTARKAEQAAGAYALARKEGRKGQDLIDRVKELKHATTPDGVAVMEQAELVATRSVFQESGPITDFLRGAQKVPGLKQAMMFVMPFIRTPGNILRQGLEVSPAGFALKGAREGGRLGAQLQGRAAAGSAAAATMAWWAATGRLSGAGPKDRAERDRLMESGWRPNSIKVGDQWVSYQLFQPLSVQAAIIGNAWDAYNESKDKDANPWSSVPARAMNSFLDQSFLVGMFDAASAVQDPERYGPRLLARTATGMVPMAGAVRSVQQATDPVVRQPDGFTENVKAALPGLSKTVEPRIGRAGQVVTREGGGLRHAADPFSVSTADQEDAVAKELHRLGVRLTSPSGRVTLPEGMSLTRKGETAVKQAQGGTVWRALQGVMASPQYQALGEEQRRRVLERVINTVRQQTNQQVRAELPTSQYVN